MQATGMGRTHPHIVYAAIPMSTGNMDYSKYGLVEQTLTPRDHQHALPEFTPIIDIHLKYRI